MEGLAVLLLLVILLFVLLHGSLGDKLLKDEIVALLFGRSLSLGISLVQVDLLVVQDAVANLAQDALNLELASPPCRGKNLASHTSFVLSALLVGPVLTTLLLHLGHVLHSLLGVDGAADGVPCLLDECALVTESAEETADAEEFLAAEEA
ncbi:hypothetical protein HG531_008753 [Fusarium graminearum]|nr:hypothetical protein HG531_008753 [Fusarium graminearum]